MDPATLIREHGITVASSPQRFAVLVIYCFYGILNQFQYVGNANIVPQLTQRLGCTNFEINMLAAVFALMYVVFSLPACEIFARLGLRISLLIGIGLNLVGAALKFVVVSWYPRFWLMIIGQTIAGGGQIFFLALPPLLAATWFPTSERSLATALGTLSGFLGMALGFAVAPAMVNPERNGVADFMALFGMQLGCCGANALACLLFVPARPTHPPSVTSPKFLQLAKSLSPTASPLAEDTNDGYGAHVTVPADAAALLKRDGEAEAEAAPSHVFSQIWALRGNRSFVILVAVFGVGAGSLTAVSAILAQLMAPFNVSQTACGTILMVGLFAGCVACVVCGPLLDKYRTYRAPLVVCYALMVVVLGTTAVLMYAVPPEGERFIAISYVVVTLIVVFTLPTLPIGMELAVELTYPLPEAVPATACMWSNGFFSLIGTLAASAIIGNSATTMDAVYVMGVIALLVLVCGALCQFVIVEDRRRLASEASVQTKN